MAKKTEKTGKNPFIVEASKERYFEVVIEGTERLLMDPMSDDTIVNVLIKRQRIPAKTDMALEDMAAEKIYRDNNGLIGIPNTNILACLREAGKKIPWGPASSRGKVTKADNTTMLHSFLKIPKPFIHLVLPDKPDEKANEEGWYVDVRKGAMKDGTAVGIVRPCFPAWKLVLPVTIDFYTSEVTEEMIGSLFFMAGKSAGLLAFRPTKGGPFGTFKVTSWEEVSAADFGKLAA